VSRHGRRKEEEDEKMPPCHSTALVPVTPLEDEGGWLASTTRSHCCIQICPFLDTKRSNLWDDELIQKPKKASRLYLLWGSTFGRGQWFYPCWLSLSQNNHDTAWLQSEVLQLQIQKKTTTSRKIRTLLELTFSHSVMFLKTRLDKVQNEMDHVFISILLFFKIIQNVPKIQKPRTQRKIYIKKNIKTYLLIPFQFGHKVPCTGDTEFVAARRPGSEAWNPHYLHWKESTT